MSESTKGNWWRYGIVYQIYPRSFKDSNGDGIGDLQGIIDKLDYLYDGTPQSLGVDAIWISPIFPSPMADFGYDVTDYCNVDPMFGDLATLDELVTQAHRRGIKVILDYVPNHTSNQHPWFLESRSSRDNPKRDWYIWKDAKPDGSPPNNWGAVFGGPAWTWDEKTGQYYMHQFLVEQPELNWRNQEVKKAMLDVLRFWLERGIDGFRMDVVGMIFKDPQFRDNPPNPEVDASKLPANDLFGRQLHIYTEDLDEVQDVIREFHQLLDEYGDRCAIGEIWFPPKRWARYFGEHGDGLQLPFNFQLLFAPWKPEAIRKSVEDLEAAVPEFGWPNYVLGNHDYPRLASRVGPPQARVAAMLLLTLRGTPTWYYGDEIGMQNGVIPADRIQDPQGRNLGPERNRDMYRTPMQWNAEPFAGFSKVEPWLPVSADYPERNVSAQSQAAGSHLDFVRRLLWLRRQTPALHRGEYRSVDGGNENCYVFQRSLDNHSYVIALNFSNQPQQVRVPANVDGNVVLSTYLDLEGPCSLTPLQLRPNEGLIIRRPE